MPVPAACGGRWGKRAQRGTERAQGRPGGAGRAAAAGRGAAERGPSGCGAGCAQAGEGASPAPAEPRPLPASLARLRRRAARRRLRPQPAGALTARAVPELGQPPCLGLSLAKFTPDVPEIQPDHFVLGRAPLSFGCG